MMIDLLGLLPCSRKRAGQRFIFVLLAPLHQQHQHNLALGQWMFIANSSDKATCKPDIFIKYYKNAESSVRHVPSPLCVKHQETHWPSLSCIIAVREMVINKTSINPQLLFCRNVDAEAEEWVVQYVWL